MGNHRIDLADEDIVELPDLGKPQMDGLVVFLVGIAFVLALGLGVQKWFMASQYTILLEHFGSQPGLVTRMVVTSPRLLAIPLVGFACWIASLGFRSRKAALFVAIGLLAANIVMYAVMFEIQLKMLEGNGAMMRSMMQMN